MIHHYKEDHIRFDKVRKPGNGNTRRQEKTKAEGTKKPRRLRGKRKEQKYGR